VQNNQMQTTITS